MVCRRVSVNPRRVRRSAPMTMNLFDRFFCVVRANLNQVVSRMENAEKVLNQTVTDMQNDLVKVR